MRIRSLVITAVLATAILCSGFIASAQTADKQALIAQIQAQIVSLMAQIVQIQAQQDTTSDWCHTFTNYLFVGKTDADTNGEVSQLQQALVKDGEGVASTSADKGGTFSEGVVAAVVQFQAKYGIAQTGTVGPVTRAKLNALYGCSNRISSSATAKSSSTSCTPKTCAELWKTCGYCWDECGGNIYCGTCPSGQVCGNGICASPSPSPSPLPLPEPGPSCTPKTCTQLGKTCGTWWNCGTNILNCGTCPIGQTCSNGTCCALKTCEQLGKTCGTWDNGCGTHMLDCGTCSRGTTCNSDGTCVLSAPLAPGRVTVSLSGTTVTLTWSAVTGATSYLYKRYDNGVYCCQGTRLAGLSTSVSDTLLAGKSYYDVFAVNAVGTSSASRSDTIQSGCSCDPWGSCINGIQMRYCSGNCGTIPVTQVCATAGTWTFGDCSATQCGTSGTKIATCQPAGAVCADVMPEPKACWAPACAGSCLSKTCAQLGKTCGYWSDECSGGYIYCGTCSSGQTCSSGNCVGSTAGTGTWTFGDCSATQCGTSGTKIATCQPAGAVCSGAAPAQVACSAPACTNIAVTYFPAGDWVRGASKTVNWPVASFPYYVDVFLCTHSEMAGKTLQDMVTTFCDIKVGNRLLASTGSATVILPTTTAPGTYYLYVRKNGNWSDTGILAGSSFSGPVTVSALPPVVTPGTWTLGDCSETRLHISGTKTYTCQPAGAVCSGAAPAPVACFGGQGLYGNWTFGSCSATQCGTTGTKTATCQPPGTVCSGTVPSPSTCSVPACTLPTTVTYSPTGDWVKGTSKTVNWSTASFQGNYVEVVFCYASNVSANTTVANAANNYCGRGFFNTYSFENTGSATFILPTTIYPGTYYFYVRMYNNLDNTYTGNGFSGPVTVTAPGTSLNYSQSSLASIADAIAKIAAEIQAMLNK